MVCREGGDAPVRETIYIVDYILYVVHVPSYIPILILWFVSEVFFKINLDNLGKDLVGIQITHETRCKHVCSATITRRYGPIHRTTGTVQSTSTRQCYRTSGTSRGEQRTCQTHRLQLPSTARILCVPHSTCLPSERLQQAPGGACGHASTHGHVAHAGSGLPGPWRRPCHRFQHSAWKFIGRVFDGS